MVFLQRISCPCKSYVKSSGVKFCDSVYVVCLFYENTQTRDCESSLAAYNARRIMRHTNDVMIIAI